MFKSTFILYCLLITLSSSCYEKIDFNIERKKFLVVDALFRSNTNKNQLALNFLEKGKSIYEPVVTAGVYVEDTEGVIFKLIHKNEGIYELGERLNVDKKYRVIIEWDGSSYKSSFETFGSHLPKIKKLDFETERIAYYNINGNKEFKDVLDINLNYFNETFNYSLFEYEGLYKVVSVTIMNPRPDTCWFKDRGVDFLKVSAGLGSKRTLFLRTLPTSKYRYYNLFIKSYSISENAFKYWKELEDLRNTDGGIYSVPPSIIRGNIYSEKTKEPVEVLGYFTLATFDSTRFAFKETDLPIALSDDCLPVSESLPTVCFSCSLRKDTISVNNAPSSWLDP